MATQYVQYPNLIGTAAIPTTPTGLTIGMRITTLIVHDTPTALPAVAFPKRNAISITNMDNSLTLYIGNSNVTAGDVVGTTSGWDTGPAESFNVDVTDQIVVYGIAPAGQTILVKVLEIA